MNLLECSRMTSRTVVSNYPVWIWRPFLLTKPLKACCITSDLLLFNNWDDAQGASAMPRTLSHTVAVVSWDVYFLFCESQHLRNNNSTCVSVWDPFFIQPTDNAWVPMDLMAPGRKFLSSQGEWPTSWEPWLMRIPLRQRWSGEYSHLILNKWSVQYLNPTCSDCFLTVCWPS